MQMSGQNGMIGSMRFFKILFASFLGTVAAFFTIIALVIGCFVGIAYVTNDKASDEKEKDYDKGVYLHLEFAGGVVDYVQQTPLHFFGSLSGREGAEPHALLDVIDMIRHAGKAKEIEGVFLDLRGHALSWTAADVIRRELLAIKANKNIIAFGESYTEIDLFLSSAASHVYLVPQGYMEFNGLSLEQLYLKRALDGLEIKPVVVRAGAYKSAAEPLIRESMSPEERDQLQAYLSSIWGYISNSMIERKPEELKDLNQAAETMKIVSATDAVDYRLIDELKYYDEVVASFSDKLMSMDKFYYKMKSDASLASLDPKIAVLYIEGEIVSGWSSRDKIGSDTVAYLLDQLKKKDDIEALVVRVNSPGGDVVASEVINRALTKMAAEMPVLISFGEVAASGGYYISAIGKTIFAEPLGVTGSIGVFTLGFNIEGLMKNKLRVSAETVKTHAMSDFMASYRAPTDVEIKILERGVNEAYQRFLEVSAEGRGKKIEDIEPLAQGRIWSGLQAKENGLVDELGHLGNALDQAAKNAKVTGPYQVVNVNDWLYWSGFWEELESFGIFSSMAALHNATLAKVAEEWGFGKIFQQISKPTSRTRPLLLESRRFIVQ